MRNRLCKSSFSFPCKEAVTGCLLAVTALFFSTFSRLEAQRLFPVKVNKKWGLINQDGKLVTDATYDAIGEFNASGLAIMQKKGKVGVINLEAEEVIEPVYEDLKILAPQLFSVREKNAWRVINLESQTILPSGYDEVEVWKGDVIGFKVGDKWGMVSSKGVLLCLAIFDQITTDNGLYFKTEVHEKVGVLNRNGSIVLLPQYDEVQIIEERIIFYKLEKKWGAVGSQGESLLDCEYDAFSRISPHFLRLYHKSQQFLFSIASQSLITAGGFDNFFAFSDHFILVKKERLLGLIDDCGNWILQPIYNEIQHYGPHFFRVNYQGKWGIVDEEDRTIIPYEFDYVAPLKGHFCLVKSGAFFGLCNQGGQLVIPARYHKIELENQQAKAFQGDSLTIYDFDKKGNLLAKGNFGSFFTITIGKKDSEEEILPNNSYQSFFVLDDYEWFYAPDKDKWGLRNLVDGKPVMEPVFDFVQVIPDLGLTLVGLARSKKVVYDRTTYRFDMSFGLVNNKEGRLLTDLIFWDIRLDDFRKGYPLARCMFENGRFGLVLKTGTVLVKDFAFIGDYSEGMARVSMKGNLSGDLNPGKNGLGSINQFLSKLVAPNRMTDFTSYDLQFNREAQLTCKDCQWGFIDTLGRMAIQPQYDYAFDCLNDVIIVRQKEKWGAVNFEGKQLIPFEFDDIHFLEKTGNRIIRVYKKEEKYGLIDTSGQIKIGAVFDDIGSFSEGKLAVQRNNLWGFVNRVGQEIIPCRFQNVANYSEGLAAAKIGNSWGYIDRLGEMMIPAQFKRVGNFSNGLAWVVTSKGTGFIDQDGKLVIPDVFQKGFDFKFGVAIVVQDGKYGLIDRQGGFLLKPKYPEIQPYNDMGLAVVRYDSDPVRYGLLNIKGELVTTTGFREIQEFREGMAAVKTKDGYGFIDIQGKLVVDPVYSKVSGFSQGRAAVQQNGKCGYIDKSGLLIVEPQYTKCLDFNDGKAIVYKGIKNAGLVNLEGEVLFEPQVNRLLDFSEGMGLVRDSSYRFYYITEQAKAVDGVYQKASEFRDGVAVVQMDGKWGIINQQGIQITPPKYDKISQFENGFAKVRIKGFNGLTNTNGETIVQPDYEYIHYAGEGLFRVEQGDKVGYFDSEGKWIWNLTE